MRAHLSHYGTTTDLKVVHVEDVVNWWPRSPSSLSRLLLFTDLLDGLYHCALVDDTKARHIVFSIRYLCFADLTYCLSSGKLVVIASGGWIGSYAELETVMSVSIRDDGSVTYVASCPAYFRMIRLPPGCSGNSYQSSTRIQLG
jgi:hypothetical protein